MINEIKIRQATIEDLPKIQKLSLELFQEEQTEHEPVYNNDWSFSEEGESFFKKELTEPNRIVFLVEDGKMPIGYLAASSYADNVFQGPLIFAELVNIFVKDEYRNRKIGTELTNKFIEWAKQKMLNV
ncbi:MAG: GNAT family N-acetyltransferase [Candidatus Berkelbacteria bacterium]